MHLNDQSFPLFPGPKVGSLKLPGEDCLECTVQTLSITSCLQLFTHKALIKDAFLSSFEKKCFLAIKRMSVSDFYLTFCFGKQEMHKTVKAKNRTNIPAFSPYWQKQEKRKKVISFACCSIVFSIMKNLIQKHFSAVTRNVSLTLSVYPTQRKTKREFYLTLGYDQPAYEEVVEQQQVVFMLEIRR